MKTIEPHPIGFAFKRSHSILIASSLTGILIVGLDILLLALGQGRWAYRFTLVLTALAAYGLMAKWDRGSLGLRIFPAQGVKYWAKVTLILGGVVSLFVVCALGFLWLLNVPIRLYFFTDPSQMLPWLLTACIAYPVLEEGICRFALCTPLAASLGKWMTIVISGVTFAALHFIYGNPGPDNLIAGFLLSWAYLKGRSILLPVILHSLGNLCVFVFQVTGYYLSNG